MACFRLRRTCSALATSSSLLVMELRTVGSPLEPTRTSASALRCSNRTSIVGKSIPTLTGDPEAYTEEFERIRQKLYVARSKRVWPGRDEKILTSWNGMMIRALAEGGLVLNRPDFIDAARKCATFLRRDVDVDEVLHRSYGGGSARIPAFLEDYAQLADGLMSLHEATLDLEWLRWARDLVETSRLYRQDAVDAGEQSVADVLDDLERSLLEIVHSPSTVGAADLEQIRRRIDAATLLFKVRVMSDELRKRDQAPGAASPRTSIRKTS